MPFINIPILITEKLDGSNVCIQSNNCYAHTHSPFDQFKALHVFIKNNIPQNLQIFVE